MGSIPGSLVTSKKGNYFCIRSQFQGRVHNLVNYDLVILAGIQTHDLSTAVHSRPGINSYILLMARQGKLIFVHF